MSYYGYDTDLLFETQYEAPVVVKEPVKVKGRVYAGAKVENFFAKVPYDDYEKFLNMEYTIKCIIDDNKFASAINLRNAYRMDILESDYQK